MPTVLPQPDPVPPGLRLRGALRAGPLRRPLARRPQLPPLRRRPLLPPLHPPGHLPVQPLQAPGLPARRHRLPGHQAALSIWFLAIYFLSQTKSGALGWGASGRQRQHRLGSNTSSCALTSATGWRARCSKSGRRAGLAEQDADAGGRAPGRQAAQRVGQRHPGGCLAIRWRYCAPHRAVYAVRFRAAVYVLHAFQKKAKRGIETPELEIRNWSSAGSGSSSTAAVRGVVGFALRLGTTLSRRRPRGASRRRN